MRSPTKWTLGCCLFALLPALSWGTIVESKEAYFNGSAYLRLFNPMPIWSHSAISFRTCRGGEILTQRHGGHILLLSVLPDSVSLSLVAPQTRVEARVQAKLLDNRWHDIHLQYELATLHLIVDKQSVVVANSTYNSQFLTDQDIKNEASVLILGNNYYGCLLHGPGLIFNTSLMHAESVLFGPCPLAPGPCGDHDILIRVPVNHCLHDPCMQHGACISRPDSYECHCTARYSGKNCEVDMGPPCLSQPCANGGSCFEDQRGDYKCSCPAGFTGTYCDTELQIHPQCEKNPCLNNGTCKAAPNGNSFECDCLKGFAGLRCEVDWDDCESQPCQNGGHCIDGVGTFNCDCTDTGYSGTLCQNNIDECNTNNPCQNGASCFDTYGSYTCECAPGYGGINCNKVVNECQAQPCLQGGTCIEHKGSFECICPHGYAGTFCEIPPTCPQCPPDSECIGGICICKPGTTGSRCESPMALQFSEECPCLNGGSCLFNSTDCMCTTNYEGSRCEKRSCEGPNCSDITEENACSNDPCLHGATCIANGLSDYTCICLSGYNGSNCENDIDECIVDKNICGNGICVNTPGGFQCYCKPGFTGNHCEMDVDECLSRPCKNNGICMNLKNDFNCTCLPGFTDKDCGTDINECASNPCSPGSTCIDEINQFKCSCMPGITGQLCEININDCESQPCFHGGQCIDGLNDFDCNCLGTGYTGEFCEINIDECLSMPCQNGAHCEDLVNDYQCHCYPGYSGKNCETDIDECEKNPCQYNGTCLQKSNTTLYELSENYKYGLPKIFSTKFSYENASGFVCLCVDGITGEHCEININECDSNPCTKYGTCFDQVGYYICECEPGFTGTHCEINIDECDLYKPCLHGTCMDGRDNYDCDCDPLWGGKNCSVPLIGCNKSPCQNSGTCIPYLVNENDHRFNCSCDHGFQGSTCEKITTISLITTSLITVNTTRDEGYDIQLRFKTTLPNGILAFGTGTFGTSYSYILGLVNGRLNLHSSLLNKWEGVFIGSHLNDSKWQKVFVAINSSHLVLSANEEQTIYPINSYEGTNASHTSFPITYLGGTIPNLSSYLRHLTHAPSSFVGCMEDVVINGQWVFPLEINNNYISLVDVPSGCPRTEQCEPNPCNSNGECTDLWHTFSCTCQRPHLGKTCKFNITAATFGNENTVPAPVIVDAYDTARRAVRSVLDISMFIKTRQATGQIFYLGSDPKKTTSNSGDSYVSAKLLGGELYVQIQFNGTPEAYTVGGNKLDNGHTHLIQVIRNSTLVQVKLNGTEYFRKTISSTGQLDAQVLYLGGPPPSSNFSADKNYFKGIIQDVKVSNGSQQMLIELFPLNEKELDLPPAFGDVTMPKNSILKGEVSDDLCKTEPCLHGATCRNTWNDFVCVCPRGYKGKYCQDIQFCEIHKCPGKAYCQNLDDGFECITNMTFQGQENKPLIFNYLPNPNQPKVAPKSSTLEITYRAKTGGTLLYVQDSDMYFEVAAFKDQVTVQLVQWKLSSGPEITRFVKEDSQFDWNTIYLRVTDNVLEGGWKGWESLSDGLPLISSNIDQSAYNHLFSGQFPIYLGGVPPLESNAILINNNQKGILDDTYLYDNSMVPVGANTISKGINEGAVFKGCLGEVRIDGLLLPYFSQTEIYGESTLKSRQHYELNSTKPDEGCILCFEDNCQNGGHCSDPTERYSCDCLAGYAADDCSENINECLSAQCTNNSTCIDGIAKYTCQCLPGYEGIYCETEINECESNPCHNGGTCTDLIARFSCDCTEDYAGPQCDILRLVTCENNPCQNGSTCSDGFNPTTGNNFTCACMTGFQGALCDTPFCEVEKCQNNGFCLTTEPTPPICKCSLGYTGKFCETEIDECASSPCMNGGKCIDLLADYRCNCSGTGFEGLHCENDIDECITGRISCGGRGSCMNTIGSFKCQCLTGLCGSECNMNDPCQEEGVCMNEGVCIENCGTEPHYICNCTEGFTGTNCTEVAQIVGAGASPSDIALIVVPIVVGLLVLGGAVLAVFLMMARNKRATRGTYSPSAQEYCNPRLEMDNVLKPPPEERLI